MASFAFDKGGNVTLSSRLKEISDRLDAATPGPWNYPAVHGDCYICFGEIVDDKIVKAVTHKQNNIALAEPNMELIANAPTDLRRLISAVKILAATMKRISEHPGNKRYVPKGSRLSLSDTYIVFAQEALASAAKVLEGE